MTALAAPESDAERIASAAETIAAARANYWSVLAEALTAGLRRARIPEAGISYALGQTKVEFYSLESFGVDAITPLLSHIAQLEVAIWCRDNLSRVAETAKERPGGDRP